ncbi:MAG: DUF3857 domain-containing protein [Bacteroidales bacterium]|nr:DUF3857 domain-containing protein [Bacteroidales bacterium]
MLKFIFTTVTIFITINLHLLAQIHIQSLGYAKFDELSMEEYPLDKEAEAVILSDKGLVHFEVNDENSGFIMIFERYTRIKILKEKGIKYADFEIPLYGKGHVFEFLREVKGFTYNLENKTIKKTEFDQRNIYEEEYSERFRIKKFTMPNVKIGSVIEIRYSYESPYFINLPDWKFQSRIPTVESEYTARMIPFYEYQFLLQGRSELDKFNSYKDNFTRHFGAFNYNDMVYEMGLKNIPAFKDESFITTIEDFIIKADFQLVKIHSTNGNDIDVIKDWKTLNKELLEHMYFGRFLNTAKRKAKSICQQEGFAVLPDDERIDKIVEYVKRNFGYTGKGKFASKNVNDFLKEKIGNGAAINLFLCALLTQEGFDAKPVILSTRDHGKVNYELPFQQFFNYTLVVVFKDGKEILLDATSDLYPNDEIPRMCRNNKGVVVDKKEDRFVNLNQTNMTSSIVKEFELNVLTGKDSLNTKSQYTYTGYDGIDARWRYKNEQEKLLKRFNDKHITINNDIKTINFHEVEEPYVISYNGNSALETIENNILVHPFINEPISYSPFKLAKRTYPVDMEYPFERVFKSTINIPDGYRVNYLPKNVNYDNSNIYIKYNAETIDNKVLITGMYKFKKSLYPALDYGKLKYYYYDIIKRFNDKVVLEPISE